MDEVTRMWQFMDRIQWLWEQDDSTTHHRQPFPPYHRHNRLHHFLQEQEQIQRLHRSCFPDSNDDDNPTSCNPKPVPEEPYHPPLAKRPRRNRKKLLNQVPKTTLMDPQIWTHLPGDILEPILARLPIPTFFQFRAVSRAWNSLLISPTFSRHLAHVPKPRPWFFTTTHENPNYGAMYDPSSNKWRHPVIPSKTVLMPVASSGGLVCFMDIGHCHFYVANPLTGVFKSLPSRPVRIWSRVAVGMTSKDDGSYKVVWVCYDGKYDVYDSALGRWTHPQRLIGGANVGPLNFESPCVSVGAVLYFFHSNGLLVYDTDMDTDHTGEKSDTVMEDTGTSLGWRELSIPLPCQVLDYVGVEHAAGVMMVGVVSRNAATCVCVWELERMTLLWKEVDRMPNVWCLELYGKPRIKMSCLGSKRGLLMLSLRYGKINRLVTYDACAREWRKIPSRGRRRGGIVAGTAFHPSLTAKP